MHNNERFSSKKEAKEAVEKGNGTELLGRPVAVDWAVAKEIYQVVVDCGKLLPLARC